MKIIIETIPHDTQRYPTAGDWYTRDGTLHIKVSEELPEKEALLVAIHELVEVSLCKDRGVTECQVDAFDIEYEKNRDSADDSEPGDSPLAPYQKEHFFATSIERLMAAELKVNWLEYGDHISALP